MCECQKKKKDLKRGKEIILYLCEVHFITRKHYFFTGDIECVIVTYCNGHKLCNFPCPEIKP